MACRVARPVPPVGGFTTAGLIIDPKMHAGFVFEVDHLFENKRIFFDCTARSDGCRAAGRPAPAARAVKTG